LSTFELTNRISFVSGSVLTGQIAE